MKNNIFFYIVCMALMLSFQHVFAFEVDFCGDNLRWSYQGGGILVISGEGEMYDYDRSSKDYNGMKNVAPWYNFRAKIQHVVIEEGVRSIGNYAFYECGNLAHVDFSSTIKRIGKYAFGECRKIDSLVIPNSVTMIQEYAFGNCNALENIVLPNKLRRIDDHVFFFCSKLTSIIIPPSVKEIGKFAFAYTDLSEITIPNTVTHIGYSAFCACTKLTYIIIPASVTYMGEHPFYRCENIREIYYPKGLSFNTKEYPNFVKLIAYDRNNPPQRKIGK